MAQITIKTARKRDADVFAAFEKIDSAIGGTGNWSVMIFIGAQSGSPQVNNAAWQGAQQLPAIVDLIKENGSLCAYLGGSNFAGLPNFSINLTRSFENSFDVVAAHIPDNQPASVVTPLMKAIETEFPSYASGAVVEQILGKEFADFYRARDQSVTRIENTLVKLIEDADRRELDNRFNEKRTQLDADIAKERDALKEEAATQSAALQERTSALETMQKELDDRSARHARRALHKDLQRQLKEHSTKFGLTSDTAKKRLPVHIIFVAALVFDASLTGLTLYLGGDSLNSASTISRLLAGVIGFAVIVILYIRWADAWFRQHADEEFRLKRMNLDVDRASWVVETAMEWEQTNKGPIPEQLLEDLTRGLFSPAEGFVGVRHPVEDLASAVLGASSNLEFEIPGLGKGMLNRRGIKRAMAAARQEPK